MVSNKLELLNFPFVGTETVCFVQNRVLELRKAHRHAVMHYLPSLSHFSPVQIITENFILLGCYAALLGSLVTDRLLLLLILLLLLLLFLLFLCLFRPGYQYEALSTSRTGKSASFYANRYPWAHNCLNDFKTHVTVQNIYVVFEFKKRSHHQQ